MKRTFTLLALAAVIVAGVTVAFSPPSALLRKETAPPVVRLGVLPSIGKTFQEERYAPFLSYLSRETGWDFRLSVAASYEELVELFSTGEVDLANFGGFTFVKAHVLYGAEPLVMRDIDYRVTTSFIVKRSSPLANCCELDCKELAGKKAVYGPELSTSGHLMPLYFLKTQKGIEPRTHFSGIRHTPGHAETALQIRDGAADVGMMHSATLKTMVRSGEIKQDELVVIWETPPYPDNVWAVQKTMDEATKTHLRNAFLALDYTQEHDKKVLDIVGASSFFPAGESEFLPLQEIALSLGLMASETSP